MSIPSFTMTKQSISGVYRGKPFTVQSGSPHFKGLHDALTRKAWDEVPNYLTVKMAVASWSDGEFTLQGDTIRYQGESIPSALARRIRKMIQRGENPAPLCRFFERLNRNPSMRSVEQLFAFLDHCNIPICDDGCFLAYKGVKSNLKDQHSGQWDNSPGAVNKMPRNRISDDPNQGCHVGFHVGALSYAKSFASRVVICKVDPEHVVSVPYDSSYEKMRVCEYEVVGHGGAKLSSTTISSRDIPLPPERRVTQATTEGKPGRTRRVKTVRKGQVAKGVKPTGAERKRWCRFNKKDAEGLLQQSLHDLRRYAGYYLGIVGATKIRGGKTALVSTICKEREAKLQTK